MLDIPNLCSLSGVACTALAVSFSLLGIFDVAMIGTVWAVAFDWADALIARRIKTRTGDDRQFWRATGCLDRYCELWGDARGVPVVASAFGFKRVVATSLN